MSGEALRGLLEELDRIRAELPARQASYARAFDEAKRLLHDIPLVRGIGQHAHFVQALETEQLVSRAALGLAPSRPEASLGIQNAVYTSAGVLYPNREFAVVLKATIESEVAADASPWDSGALCGEMLEAHPGEARRAIFLKYRLGSPHWREYLVHYVASCYHSPLDYLCLRRHAYRDPLGAMSSSWTSRCFEVRLTSPVQLKAVHLAAIFSRRERSDRAFLKTRELLASLERKGVDVKFYDGNWNQLRSLVMRWMCDRSL